LIPPNLETDTYIMLATKTNSAKNPSSSKPKEATALLRADHKVV